MLPPTALLFSCFAISQRIGYTYVQSTRTPRRLTMQMSTKTLNTPSAMPTSTAAPVSPTGLMLGRVSSPLVPDLHFGRSWGEWVEGYAQRFGVLPQVFRAVQVSEHRVILCELQVDAAGYGRVRVAGELAPTFLPTMLEGLLGRFGCVIVDASLLEPLKSLTSVMSDSELHARCEDELGRAFSVEPELWRAKLHEGLCAGRSLPLRAALERVRAEMMALVAVSQTAS